MSHALGNHKNTLVLDADILFLNPIRRFFREALVMSPELNDYRVFVNNRGKEYAARESNNLLYKNRPGKKMNEYQHQLHDVFGLFNAGFLFTQDKEFPEWWKYNFLNKSGFLEQETLNRACRDFTFGIFDEQHNYGFWKLLQQIKIQIELLYER